MQAQQIQSSTQAKIIEQHADTINNASATSASTCTIIVMVHITMNVHANTDPIHGIQNIKSDMQKQIVDAMKHRKHNIYRVIREVQLQTTTHASRAQPIGPNKNIIGERHIKIQAKKTSEVQKAIKSTTSRIISHKHDRRVVNIRAIDVITHKINVTQHIKQQVRQQAVRQVRQQAVRKVRQQAVRQHIQQQVRHARSMQEIMQQHISEHTINRQQAILMQEIMQQHISEQTIDRQQDKIMQEIMQQHISEQTINRQQDKIMQEIMQQHISEQTINRQQAILMQEIMQQHISGQVTNIQQSVGQIMHAVIHDAGRSGYIHSNMINGGHKQ